MKNEAEFLAREIIKHKNLYYHGKTEISDYEYDELEERLRNIQPDHPVLNIVGNQLFNTSKVPHDKKMLSLNKTYSIDELKKWLGELDYIALFKIDGSSLSLLYENGKLKLAKTRGDGEYGEDVTSKIFFIEEIPKTIPLKEGVEIRGEVYCKHSSFHQIKLEFQRRELPEANSVRNIVAGILGRKDNIDVAKFLSFQAFDLISKKERKFEIEKIDELASFGFTIPNVYKKKDTIENILNEAEEFISNGDYLIDGVVFIINDIQLQNEMGETSHHPRYKIAFKFKGETGVTKVKEIVWQVSRNGVLTPVASIEPLVLSGAKITRLTLHHWGVVKKFYLKPGDEIEIIRSGEVIPKFLRTVNESDGLLQKPDNCPSCKTKLTEEDIRLICENKACPGRKLASIIHFIQKIGIEDLSSKRIEVLMKTGLVKSIPDLYRLRVEDLLSLDQYQEKLASKIIKSINQSKETNLVTFLSSLGIEGASKNRIELIKNEGFKTIQEIQKAREEQLVMIQGLGPKSVERFKKSLDDKKMVINELLNLGFVIEVSSNEETSHLAGKSFCITGKLSKPRAEIENDIKKHGGKVLSSVSKTLSYLVTNEKESNSSKFKKATSLNISIVSEEELMHMIEALNERKI